MVTKIKLANKIENYYSLYILIIITRKYFVSFVMSELNPKITSLFESIDRGMEQNLHKKYGGELEKLMNEKYFTDKQKTFIMEVHFTSMAQRMSGKDHTIAYRRGIRQIFTIPEHIKNNITNIVENILKVMKDYNFCEHSQLKLFLNLVKMCLYENIQLLKEDDVKIMVNNWVEEIKPEEKMIIKNNEYYIFILPVNGL